MQKANHRNLHPLSIPICATFALASIVVVATLSILAISAR